MLKLKIGMLVEVPSWEKLHGPNVGNITQIGTRKARVLFPIRKFVWLPLDSLKPARKIRAERGRF